MKVSPKSLEEWHEINYVLQACEFHRNVFLRQESELHRLLPELDKQTIADLANGVIILVEMEVKENEVA
jgi:hypothetical protein